MTYMFTRNENDIAKAWRTYEGFTVRPVASTVHYYQACIEKYKNKKNFLLYGGTPEIRSLFQNYHLPLTIIDKSEDIVRALGQLTHAARPLADNECLTQCDWLDTTKISTSFDFMIGDDAINMVPWGKFENFLSNAHCLLNADGLFACHLLVQPSKTYRENSVDEIYMEYKTGKIKSIYDLASRLNFICYDTTSYRMGWQQTIRQLGKEQLDVFKPHFDFIQHFSLCNSHFYCPPQTQFEQLVQTFFHIEEIFYPSEHDYCLFEPVYLLKKRLT